MLVYYVWLKQHEHNFRIHHLMYSLQKTLSKQIF